jgi:hypothetical protein
VLIEDVARLKPIDRLMYWIKERHNIFLRRRAGLPAPWTDDVILQSFFFTNPYRENDKFTVWLREKVRGPLRDDRRVLFAVIAARWFCWAPTIQVLMGKNPCPEYRAGRLPTQNLLEVWDLEEALCRLGAWKGQGEQVFTGAFNISNSGSTKPKINRVCEDYIQPAWEACGADRPSGHTGWMMEELVRGAYEQKSTMQDAHELLGQLPGMGGGGFMAYEVVCDLRYTLYLEHAPDKLTWSNPGPGAKRGMNVVLGRDPKAPLDRETWDRESRRLLAEANRRLRMPPMEMREIEHSLCEFFKMERARLGGGSKRRYNGGGAATVPGRGR